MATTLFALRVTVGAPKETKSLSPNDRDTLFRKPLIESKKVKNAGSVPRAELIEDKPLDDSLSLSEISTGYTELIAKADDLLLKLKGRVGELTYEFKPEQKPDLAQSIADIFQGENSRITYSMYLEALRLDKDLSIAIGEESHGLSR